MYHETFPKDVNRQNVHIYQKITLTLPAFNKFGQLGTEEIHTTGLKPAYLFTN